MTDQATQLCAIAVGGEHRAHDGMLICRHHLENLGRLLREAETEAAELVIAPSLAVAYDTGRSGSLASQKAPVRLEPLVLTDRRRGTGVTLHRDLDEHGWDDTPSVLETLHAWARQVRDERLLGTPAESWTDCVDRYTPRRHGPAYGLPCRHPDCSGATFTRTVPIPPTIGSERQLLTRHLDWIARQPWVDDFHTELHDLVTALKRANNSQETPVGICETLLPGGELCDGQVWHVLIKPDGTVVRAARTAPSPDDEPGFRCGRCRRVWTGTDAVRKRDQMWRDEQARKASA